MDAFDVFDLGDAPDEILARLQAGRFCAHDIVDDPAAACSDANYADAVRRIDEAAPARFNADPAQISWYYAEVLAALETVNAVVLFDEDVPEAIIREIEPDVLVKGEDWREKGVVGREFVESHGGSVSVDSALNVGSAFTIRLPMV